MSTMVTSLDLEATRLITWLITYRVNAQITRTHMVHRTGLSMCEISDFESGADFYVSTLQRYAGALGWEIRFDITTEPTQ